MQQPSVDNSPNPLILYNEQGEVIEIINNTSGNTLSASTNALVFNSEVVTHTISQDEMQLRDVLQSWNLSELLPTLTGAGITYRSLQYISKDDIKEAILDIGLRAEFREKLIIWKKDKLLNTDDDTATYVSKVSSWFQNVDEISPAASPGCSSTASYTTSHCKLSKNLVDLLNDSHKGKAILQFYKTQNKLDALRRDDLITIILEDVRFHENILCPKDYSAILNQIKSIFPAEEKSLDYYYFGRGKRRNPGGRLYNRFVNTSTKLRKSNLSTKPSTATSASSCNNQEFDVIIAYALKTSLAREIDDWHLVKEKWEKTFLLRRKEINSVDFGNSEFLKGWPLYAHSNAKELIEIDFRLLYPDKEFLLYSNWEGFKPKIKDFYAKNINDKACKELLALITDITDNSSADYIISILLNAIIRPTARFGNSKEKNTKKATIKDAQESFTLRIPTINDFQRCIAELRCKYFNRGLTVQPLIVVIGLSPDLITDYFVYFDEYLQRHESYLSCLDTCFKIFHILSLEYPQASYGPWLFIQKYFFKILTNFDKPAPSVSSLIAFLSNSD